MKFMKYASIIALAAFLFVGCTHSPESDLDKKKEELTKAEASLDSINKVIAGLKAEIEELDTNARTKTFPVMVEEIQKGAFKNPFQIQGLVESNQNVMVSPEVPANVVKIHVREGQRVSKGQLIASLDGSVASAQISELENALTLAETNYTKQERL